MIREPHFGGAFLIIILLMYNIGMIYLEKDTVNTFVLTLTEVTTISNPYYLFEFEDEFDTTANPIYWEGVDTSSWPSRYNLFTIDEPADVELVKGQYKYKVYESPVSTLDPTGLNMIEEGRMVVAGITVNSIYD
jgi:hypothetical protein